MSSDEPAAELARDLGYAIKRAQHALRLKMDRGLRPIGLTTPQYSVLSAIAADPGASNAHLARRAFVTPQTMQEMLANLERAALIARRPHPSHGRILHTELTEAGEKLLRRAHRRMDPIAAILVARLGIRDAEHVAKALAEAAAALEADPPG
jgi:DNA-binding MarR family transcriptional regulator